MMSRFIFVLPINHDKNALVIIILKEISIPCFTAERELPSSNFFSSSALPIAFAAWHICLSSSSSRLMHRMMLPSKASVILQSWEKGAPLAHACTTSIRWGLKEDTYKSSSIGSLASDATWAILRAESCSSQKQHWVAQ